MIMIHARTIQTRLVTVFIVYNRSFIRHVLLPSIHPPVEDGKTWMTVNSSASEHHLSRTLDA